MKFFLCLVLIAYVYGCNKIIHKSIVTYDDSLARNIFWPLASTSYGVVPETCVKKLFNNSEFVHRLEVVCDKQNDTCSAFVAVAHDYQAILLVFRGTNSDKELYDESQSTFHDPKVYFFSGGNVNSWFSEAFTTLWNLGIRDYYLSTRNKYPSYNLWITGHSLGGALSSLSSAYISKLGYTSSDKILVYTFGQPRVGDSTYAKNHDTLVKNHFRIVHKADKVALNPPRALNYTHHGTEVWYNNDMTLKRPYVVCQTDEDPNCSDSVAVANENMADHFLYFNRPFNYTKYGC